MRRRLCGGFRLDIWGVFSCSVAPASPPCAVLLFGFSPSPLHPHRVFLPMSPRRRSRRRAVARSPGAGIPSPPAALSGGTASGHSHPRRSTRPPRVAPDGRAAATSPVVALYDRHMPLGAALRARPPWGAAPASECARLVHRKAAGCDSCWPALLFAHDGCALVGGWMCAGGRLRADGQVGAT